MLDVFARIKLLPTADGGRRSSVRTGYRPNIRFGDLYTDGSFTFVDREEALPGDECEARLTFVNPSYVSDYLQVGSRFDITEGPRKVGEGQILSIP
ncbi:MAG: hypothetical protein D6773_03670 [Alphaproteobacteria bacterium]|nr:MAG: hypothetical protein D6773_03670 [Alphaproteobacteria bacterium]